LSKAAAAAGVALNIDENGLITNYEEQMTALHNELNRREKKSNTLSGDAKTRYDEDNLTPLKERIEELQKAI
jgi:hypothetical protein